MNKNYILLLLLIGVHAANAHFSTWPDFDEIDSLFAKQFEYHWQEMRNMRSRMKAIQTKIYSNATPELKARIEEDDVGVKINIEHLDTQELEAHVDDEDDTLTITTPHERISICLKGSLVRVRLSQEKKQENKESYSFNRYATEFSQTISDAITWGDQTLHYDPTNKKLVVSIPKPPKRKLKSVPVTIVSNKKSH